MLDVDTVATFMISIVMNYFSSCGESLEIILDDNTETHSTFRALPSCKDVSDLNQHRSGPVVAYCVDGMTICHSIDLHNERQPFKTQKINGTDLIFFPRPSSEMPYPKKPLLRRKQPLPPPQTRGQRTSSDDKSRPDDLENSSPVENSTFTLRKISHNSTKADKSTPSEVASQWIAMGLLKENIKSTMMMIDDD